MDSSQIPKRLAKGQISGNTVILLVCMIIASLLFFLTKLSHNYISDVNGSVTYTKIPQDRILTTPLKDKLRLMVETTGFNLLIAKITGIGAHVAIDLEPYKNANYILSNQLLPDLSKSAGIRILAVNPDTIHLHFDTKYSKMVPVAPDYDITFEKQFEFSEPLIISPDSILISGPKSIIDSIMFWETKKIKLEKISASMEKTIDLLKPAQKNISISPTQTNFIITVEQFTEVELEIDIEIVNLPENVEINVYPNKVKVVFRVGLSNYEQLNKKDFKAVTDFSKLDIYESQYTTVEILKTPRYIKNLTHSPKSVEYIIFN